MPAASVKESPILMTGEMVQATLADLKTQTRRVVKPQPQFPDGVITSNGTGNVYTSAHLRATHREDGWYVGVPGSSQGPWRCPYGGPGDLLWVRETWGVWNDGRPSPVRGQPADPVIVYRADDEDPDRPADEHLWEPFRWRPSIHMPKKLCRLWLTVKDVRVERVQDISEADAKAEGVSPAQVWGNTLPGAQATIYRRAFQQLWGFLNAKRGHGWDTNPWVWVIEFARTEVV